MNPSDTKARILDSAERLFAESGVDATSLRAITAAAGVNLAAVNYHFGSKEGLIEAVYDRRLGPLNRERLERLDAVLDAAGASPPSLEAILQAFLAPPFRLHRERGGEVCLRLVGRTFAGPHGPGRDILIARFRDVARRFHAALCRALPHLDADEVLWRMFFMGGTLAHTMSAADVMESMAGKDARRDRAAVLRRLVTFVTAGMRAPSCGAEEPSS